MEQQQLGRRYWITSIGDDKNKRLESRGTARTRLKTLLSIGWYLFAENTPGRKRMTPGDQLCFYLKGIGVVARAELGESVGYPPPELKEFIREKFKYPFRLRSNPTRPASSLSRSSRQGRPTAQ